MLSPQEQINLLRVHHMVDVQKSYRRLSRGIRKEACYWGRLELEKQEETENKRVGEEDEQEAQKKETEVKGEAEEEQGEEQLEKGRQHSQAKEDEW